VRIAASDSFPEGHPKRSSFRFPKMASQLSIEQMNELFYIAGYKPPVRTREMLIPCDVPDWAIVLFGHFYLETKSYDTAIVEFDKLVEQFIDRTPPSISVEGESLFLEKT
jgi:hypothetical protein